MKVSFFEVADYDRDGLSGLSAGFEVEFFAEKLTPETLELARESEIISVFINSEIRKDMIDQLSKLKCIVTRSTGFDHIDVGYAKDRGIVVSRVPAYGAHTVAEFTFGLLLDLSRKISEARHATIEAEPVALGRLEGFDLFGKTIGVIGTGRIGLNVIRIAKGFGLRVIACDAFPNEDVAKKEGFEHASLEDLLKQSDIVTLHVPYTKDTHHLLNASNIMSMKSGSYLVNTARGELVETDALVRMLESGHIAGAALDVLEGERELRDEAYMFAREEESSKEIKTLFEDHVLMRLPNVVITPHIAFFTKEAVQEICVTTLENIVAFRDGAPKNTV